ncbi:hypothetical protein M959_08537 [Chaetura pelagica]|nr:hypothetical protein M959_08537 [Chaetura pelagica]
MFMARKTVVAFPQRAVVSSLEEENLTTSTKEGGLRKELVEEETSSSSSSDSDSSSDSEEENDSEVAIKTKVEFPRQDSILSENIAVKASMLAKENLSQKSHKEYVAKKKPYKPETDVSSVKQVACSKTSVSRKTPKAKAKDPEVKSTLKEDRQKLVFKPPMVESQNLTDVTHKSDYLEEKSIKTQVAAIQLKASSMSQEDKKQKPVSKKGKEKKMKEAQESEAEVTAPKLEETYENTMLVMGTTAKEETIQEAGLQAGEGSTIEAATEPAPEEFDNSTYKNLQHHEYNVYTFFDYIEVLAKFRQPQPSSGRPSPRH